MPLKDSVILQIIPAQRVMAIFKNEDGTEDVIPVICWALLEFTDQDGDRLEAVKGMVFEEGSTSLHCVANLADFVSYTYL